MTQFDIITFLFVSMLSGALVFALLYVVLFIASKLRDKNDFLDDRYFKHEIAKAKKENINNPPTQSKPKLKPSDIKDIKFANTKKPIEDKTMLGISSTFSSHGYDFIEDKVVLDVGLLAKMGVAQDGSAVCIWGHPLVGVWFEVYKKNNEIIHLWTNNHVFSKKTIRKDQKVRHSNNLTIHDVKLDLKDLPLNDKDNITKDNVIDFMKSEHRKTQMKYHGLLD